MFLYIRLDQAKVGNYNAAATVSKAFVVLKDCESYYIDDYFGLNVIIIVQSLSLMTFLLGVVCLFSNVLRVCVTKFRPTIRVVLQIYRKLWTNNAVKYAKNIERNEYHWWSKTLRTLPTLIGLDIPAHMAANLAPS